MKAVIWRQYGSPEVLQLQEVESPQPKDNGVLIKVHATTVTSGDCRLRGLNIPILFRLPVRLWLGLFKPRRKILGVDLAGEVVSVGRGVSQFKQGDQVFGSAFDYGFGAYAEYMCMPEKSVLAIKPANLPYSESAAIFFGAHTALYFLRQANIQRGQKLLVYGASGAVGSYAVQLGKYFGAKVSGVCSSGNLDSIKALGADKVIDYTKEDFTRNGEHYDIIFDTVGKSPFSASVLSLTAKGYYLKTVHMDFVSITRGLWVSTTTGKHVIGGTAHESVEDLIFLRNLVEAGEIKPLIDRSYPLEKIVEAHRYVEQGHKRGNVVITIEPTKIESDAP